LASRSRELSLSEFNFLKIYSTSAKAYAGVSEEGLFQFGLSCDHRSDLPQVKISLSALDPLGLLLTVEGKGPGSFYFNSICA
jgi:transposase